MLSEVYDTPFRELWMRDGLPAVRPAADAAAVAAATLARAWTSPSSSSSTPAPARAAAPSSCSPCSQGLAAASAVEHGLTAGPGRRDAAGARRRSRAASGASSPSAATAPGATSATRSCARASRSSSAWCRAAPAATSPRRSASRRATCTRCCRIVLEGRTRAIDVGRIEDKLLPQHRAASATTSPCSRTPGTWRYLEGDRALPVLRAAPAPLVPGLPARGRGRRARPARGGEMLMVIVANARIFGGGFRVAPHADLEDGRLDVVSFAQHGPGRRASGRWCGCSAARTSEHPQVDSAAGLAARVPLRRAARLRDRRRVEPGRRAARSWSSAVPRALRSARARLDRAASGGR